MAPPTAGTGAAGVGSPGRARRARRGRLPEIPPAAPRHGTAFTHAIGRTALRIAGWRMEGEIPNVPRLVAIAAPHTCTIDVLVGIAVLLALGVRVRWLAKHTIFRGPVGSLLRWLGGIPVNRAAPGGLVTQAIALMRESPSLYLALAPEGTRRKVARWKTGFYHVAHACQVPIVPVALDYRAKAAVIGTPLLPTGDYDADLATLRLHFCAEMARHPERY
jgi:1-acyl-sn-glycerol-3-phosphate acyltransferase